MKCKMRKNLKERIEHYPMEKIMVSVIMSSYNPKDTQKLFRAVRSVIRQSYRNWELILIDDGSHKKYAEKIRKASALDKRIHYIRNENNKGLAFSLNKGIRLAKGKYIARMDDDDYSRKDRLEKQVEFLNNYPQYQWVGSNALLKDQNGIWGCRKMPVIPGKKDFFKCSPYIHPSVMFRKFPVFAKEGYCISKAFAQCEDYELFLRLYDQGYRGYNLQEPLLIYQEDEHSYEKRKYDRRIRETKLRYNSFKKLKVNPFYRSFFVIKPLLVGCIPGAFQHRMWKNEVRKKKYDSRAKKKKI